MSASSNLSVAFCLVAGGLFAAGSAKLRKRSRRMGGTFTVVAGAGGLLILALTLLPPLHHWSEELFSFHMVSHSLLMAIAAPLLAVARPGLVMLSALPRPLRRTAGRAAARLSSSATWKWVTQPLPATLAHGMVIWIWHLPAFFIGALESEWLHWLQHASFFLAALLFWHALFGNPRTRSEMAVSVGCLFVTMLHTGLLGALLTFSSRLWYPAAPGAEAWGLSPAEDQQLAGLFMWIPVGTVYLLAALLLTSRLISPQAVGENRAHATFIPARGIRE